MPRLRKKYGRPDASTDRLYQPESRHIKLEEDVTSQIVKSVQGMFLLAQLHLDSLRDKTSVATVRKAPRQLPSGSDAYYDAYYIPMERVTGQQPGHKDLAIQVLSWITCARRPLTIQELRHALAVEVGTEELDMDASPDTDIILQVCIGLVTVDKSDSIIRLVHYTTQEYFEKTREIWFLKAESYITTTCVTYLNFRTFKSGPPRKDADFKEPTPLYLYAANNWAFQARNAGAICEGVIDFLESAPNVASSAQVCMRPEMAIWTSKKGEDVDRRARGLHLAAFFGAIAETRVLLSTNDVELKDGYGRTAIFYAARTGQEAVMSLLLDGGAKADLQDNGGNTPLSLAAAYGHEESTKLLLANNVKTDTADSLRRTPLASHDHGPTTARNGASTNSKSMRLISSPLSEASRWGDMAMVKLLLEYGAQVDSNEGHGNTPLEIAARYYHIPILLLLLHHGKSINLKDLRLDRALEEVFDDLQRLLELSGPPSKAPCLAFSEAVPEGRFSFTKRTLEASIRRPPCECRDCENSFYPVEMQRHAQHSYHLRLSDAAAERNARSLVQSIHRSRDRLSNRIQVFGDVLMSRWKKRSQAKRAALLKEAAPDLEEEQWIIPRYSYTRERLYMRARSPIRRRQLLLPWLNVHVLKTNPAVLFALLHYRTAYSPQSWATFDNRQLTLSWADGTFDIDFCSKCIVMYGDEYGSLVDWEAKAAHRGDTLGYPRAMLVLEAQAHLLQVLCNIVDKILEGVDPLQPPRAEKWHDVVSHEAFKETGAVEFWSPYTNQAFSRPPTFNCDYLITLAKSRLDDVGDHLWYLQCDSAYMKRHVKMISATEIFKKAPAAQRAIMIPEQIVLEIQTYCCWRWIESECMHVETIRRRFSDCIYPGMPLPPKYDKALGALELLLFNQVMQKLLFLQEQLPHIPGMQKHWELDPSQIPSDAPSDAVGTTKRRTP
ncbi:hypothetical protein FANTH_3811 [Fusarium anthophilum]|uniref:GPI inositol-deacylase winged helix domain-containing protein n=1 Tax=Fusarium anthophilum TaxID=48485 RepID=A0A8H4ZRE3_9HYPO|nr:hypothetical protein FANTH_3811 [Fusarium anthophilum]